MLNGCILRANGHCFSVPDCGVMYSLIIAQVLTIISGDTASKGTKTSTNLESIAEEVKIDTNPFYAMSAGRQIINSALYITMTEGENTGAHEYDVIHDGYGTNVQNDQNVNMTENPCCILNTKNSC